MILITTFIGIPEGMLGLEYHGRYLSEQIVLRTPSGTQKEQTVTIPKFMILLSRYTFRLFRSSEREISSQSGNNAGGCSLCEIK